MRVRVTEERSAPRPRRKKGLERTEESSNGEGDTEWDDRVPPASRRVGGWLPPTTRLSLQPVIKFITSRKRPMRRDVTETGSRNPSPLPCSRLSPSFPRVTHLRPRQQIESPRPFEAVRPAGRPAKGCPQMLATLLSPPPPPPPPRPPRTTSTL